MKLLHEIDAFWRRSYSLHVDWIYIDRVKGHVFVCLRDKIQDRVAKFAGIFLDANFQWWVYLTGAHRTFISA